MVRALFAPVLGQANGEIDVTQTLEHQLNQAAVETQATSPYPAMVRALAYARVAASFAFSDPLYPTCLEQALGPTTAVRAAESLALAARGSGSGKRVDNGLWQAEVLNPVDEQRAIALAYDVLTDDPNDDQVPRVLLHFAIFNSAPEAEEERLLGLCLANDPYDTEACGEGLYEKTGTGEASRARGMAASLAAQGDHAGALLVMQYLLGHDAQAAGQDGGTFLARPARWQEFSTCYDGYLKMVPEDNSVRTAWLRMAVDSSHWADADRIRRTITAPDVDQLDPPDQYEQWLRQIARHVRAGVPNPGDTPHRPSVSPGG